MATCTAAELTLTDPTDAPIADVLGVNVTPLMSRPFASVMRKSAPLASTAANIPADCKPVFNDVAKVIRSVVSRYGTVTSTGLPPTKA